MSCDISDSATCLEINERCRGTATLTYPEKFYRNLVPDFTKFERKFDSVTLPTLMYVHFNVLTYVLAFVYSFGKCMTHKSRPMSQKN